MNFLFAIVAGSLVGYLVKPRGLAVAIFLALESWFFTFEVVVVLLGWMAGAGGFGGATQQGAFGPAPTGFPLEYSSADMWEFGAVNLVALLLGVGVTVGVHVLAGRRAARRAARRDVVSVG